jgi:histidinol-phosphatase (PHP family)
MLVSYHNHTTWSDGGATLAAQIQAARAAGLDELGISDHFVLHPSGEEVEWSIQTDLLGDYVLELRAAAAEVRGLTLRLGIEADFFPETVDALRERLAAYPFDYVIGSVHYLDDFPVDEDTCFWDALTQEQVDEKWRLYWLRMSQLAESRVYDFAAHPDLPKKFGHRPSADLTREAGKALDALAAARMSIEINTAGWSLPAAEAYPSLDLLRQARRREIPLLINADAHFAEFLTRDFARARALAREAGYTELVRYEKRERFPYPL